MSVNDNRTSPATVLFSVAPGSSENSATFIFGNEDHTLGNSLRHILIRREETDFCGYSVPHPYEPKLNLRLQTECPVIETLKAGLQDLEETAYILDDAFTAALKTFASH